jgi:hypothetical protein
MMAVLLDLIGDLKTAKVAVKALSGLESAQGFQPAAWISPSEKLYGNL